MGKGRTFLVTLCAALVWGPRASDSDDRMLSAVRGVSAPAESAYAQRVDGQIGVWTSFDAAVAWLRNRAAAGDADARYELSHLQFTGIVETRVPGEMMALLSAAAEANQDQAQLLLGRLHELGLEGLRSSPVEALRWYLRAAQVATTADLRIAAEEACQRLRSRLTLQQVAEAETAANLTWAEVQPAALPVTRLR